MSFDTERPLKHIIIPGDSFVFPWLRVSCRPTEDEWHIIQVDAYTSAEEACVGRSPGCLADDIRPAELTPSGLLWLEGQLRHWQHQRREEDKARLPVLRAITYSWLDS